MGANIIPIRLTIEKVIEQKRPNNLNFIVRIASQTAVPIFLISFLIYLEFVH